MMHGNFFYLITYISAMISKSILRGTDYTFIAEKICKVCVKLTGTCYEFSLNIATYK